jgi:hypothetical protein
MFDLEGFFMDFLLKRSGFSNLFAECSLGKSLGWDYIFFQIIQYANQRLMFLIRLFVIRHFESGLEI